MSFFMALADRTLGYRRRVLTARGVNLFQARAAGAGLACWQLRIRRDPLALDGDAAHVALGATQPAHSGQGESTATADSARAIRQRRPYPPTWRGRQCAHGLSPANLK